METGLKLKVIPSITLDLIILNMQNKSLLITMKIPSTVKSYSVPEKVHPEPKNSTHLEPLNLALLHSTLNPQLAHYLDD